MARNRDSEPRRSRRQVLYGVSGAVATAPLLSRWTQAEGEPVLREVVIPKVEQFENNYVGQFLIVAEPGTESPPDAVSECELATWDAENTQMYVAQVADRLQEEPVSVLVDMYADGTKAELAEDTIFVINRVEQCPGDYVGLEIESIPINSVIGAPPGPTVAETTTDGAAGPGLVGAAGVVGGALLAALRRARSRE